jgi:hypothetical protein
MATYWRRTPGGNEHVGVGLPSGVSAGHVEPEMMLRVPEASDIALAEAENSEDATETIGGMNALSSG